MRLSISFVATTFALCTGGSNGNIYQPDGYAIGVDSHGIPIPALAPVPAQYPDSSAHFSTASSIPASSALVPASIYPDSPSVTQAEAGYTLQTGVAADQFSLESASGAALGHNGHNGAATAVLGKPGNQSHELGGLSGDQSSEHRSDSLSSTHYSSEQQSSAQESGAQSVISTNGMVAVLLIIGTALATTAVSS